MVYEEGAFKKRQSDSCWNGLDFNDNDGLIVKDMSLLAVLLPNIRTGHLLFLVIYIINNNKIIN